MMNSMRCRCPGRLFRTKCFLSGGCCSRGAVSFGRLLLSRGGRSLLGSVRGSGDINIRVEENSCVAGRGLIVFKGVYARGCCRSTVEVVARGMGSTIFCIFSSSVD